MTHAGRLSIALRQPSPDDAELVVTVGGDCTVHKLSIDQLRLLALQSVQALCAWPVHSYTPLNADHCVTCADELEWRIVEADHKKASTPMSKLVIGDHVEKINGYRWPGVVVAVFHNLKRELRVVVECTVPEVAGALHIYAPEQLRVVEAST